MHLWAIGLGVICCAGGALAHFIDPMHRHEGALGLAGFGFLLAGLFLER